MADVSKYMYTLCQETADNAEDGYFHALDTIPSQINKLTNDNVEYDEREADALDKGEGYKPLYKAIINGGVCLEQAYIKGFFCKEAGIRPEDMLFLSAESKQKDENGEHPRHMVLCVRSGHNLEDSVWKVLNNQALDKKRRQQIENKRRELGYTELSDEEQEELEFGGKLQEMSDFLSEYTPLYAFNENKIIYFRPMSKLSRLFRTARAEFNSNLFMAKFYTEGFLYKIGILHMDDPVDYPEISYDKPNNATKPTAAKLNNG